MKNNQLIAALVGVLLLCSAWSAYLSLKYRSALNQLQLVQNQAAYVNAVRPVLEALLADTVEYSKKNPAVNPILQSITNRAAKPAATTTAPKPAAK